MKPCVVAEHATHPAQGKISDDSTLIFNVAILEKCDPTFNLITTAVHANIGD